MKLVLALVLERAVAAPVAARPPRKMSDAGPWQAPITGTLEREPDPTGAVPGTIGIVYEFYPQSEPTQPNQGSIVAVEGGLGYPSTGTRAS
jgi:hypothetical protein